MQLNLPQTPRDAVRSILGNLSGRRMRDVLEKRFGLRASAQKTLEAIGREYKITRERVRQIEAEALRHVRAVVKNPEYQEITEAFRRSLDNQGGMVAKAELLESVSGGRESAHALFFLGVAPGIHAAGETAEFHARWATDAKRAETGETALKSLAHDLERGGTPISREALGERLVRYTRELFGEPFDDLQQESLIRVSKKIRRNPYGEYGLVGWSAITPSGVRDKAYTALRRHGKPMHFLQVAGAITAAQWSRRTAHPQTVHNELIKDSRFVLVGRGLYALVEWGYEPGPVREIIASVLKRAGRPLTREEIVHAVLQKRFVKPPTILLNLQNASLFARSEEGAYTLI